MSDEQYQRGRARLRLGALVLFAFPGSPTIYYEKLVSGTAIRIQKDCMD